MNASPELLRSSRSVSVSTNGYRYGTDGAEDAYGYGMEEDEGTPRGSRGVSISTNDYEDMEEYLGAANEIHDIEEGDSSDSSIRPPPRRRRYANPTRAANRPSDQHDVCRTSTELERGPESTYGT